MALEFYITPNPLNPDKDDYKAVSLNPDSNTLEDIYEDIARAGSGITKAEAMAGFEEVTRTIIKFVKQGNAVVTPLIKIRPSLGGVFDDISDRYDPDRHKVRINVSAGQRLKKIGGQVEVQRVAARERRPVPVHFYDIESGERDRVISPGGGARIIGNMLKVDDSDEEQGIFYINQENGSETRVDARIVRNKPKELIFINPDLEPGTYRLVVRSLLQKTTKVRTGELPDELTVA